MRYPIRTGTASRSTVLAEHYLLWSPKWVILGRALRGLCPPQDEENPQVAASTPKRGGLDRGSLMYFRENSLQVPSPRQNEMEIRVAASRLEALGMGDNPHASLLKSEADSRTRG